MSEVEHHSGSVYWTIKIVFDSLRLQKSKPFIMQVAGQSVTFTLSAANVSAPYLYVMQKVHDTHVDGQQFCIQNWIQPQVAIYLKSNLKVNLDFVPKLELMANNGSWYNLPINWFGRNGTTSDQLFFGSILLMSNGRLRDEYLINDQLKIKLTVPATGLVKLVANSARSTGEITVYVCVPSPFI